MMGSVLSAKGMKQEENPPKILAEDSAAQVSKRRLLDLIELPIHCMDSQPRVPGRAGESPNPSCHICRKERTIMNAPVKAEHTLFEVLCRRMAGVFSRDEAEQEQRDAVQ
jgi:hypothetical protein